MILFLEKKSFPLQMRIFAKSQYLVKFGKITIFHERFFHYKNTFMFPKVIFNKMDGWIILRCQLVVLLAFSFSKFFGFEEIIVKFDVPSNIHYSTFLQLVLRKQESSRKIKWRVIEGLLIF